MIEFTLSRVCLTVCGIVLLTSVSASLIVLYDGSVDGRVQTLANDTAGLMDRFDRSSADVMTLSMREILPGPEYIMEVDGHLLMLGKEQKRYSAVAVAYMGSGTFTYNDIIEIRKAGNGLVLESLTQAR